MQGSLDNGLEAGTVTTRQYTQMKAALAVRENSLREAISGGMRTLNERIQTESRAVDSIMALQKRLQELTTAYYNLSKADREGNAGRGILKEIGDLDKEIQTAQSRLSAYSRSAGTGFYQYLDAKKSENQCNFVLTKRQKPADEFVYTE